MTSYLIRVEPAGWTFVAQEGMSLLAAGAAAGIVLPSSCRNGTCRSCMCGTVGSPGAAAAAAAVRYLIEWPGLSSDEKLAGDVLPCVAVAQADLVLLAPAARKEDTGIDA